MRHIVSEVEREEMAIDPEAGLIKDKTREEDK